MKRKQLVAIGILSICLLTCGCGSDTTVTEQGAEDTVIAQKTEVQEAEIEEIETRGTETHLLSSLWRMWEEAGVY